MTQFLLSVITGPDVTGLICLVIANLVVGVTAAIMADAFDWKRLPQFAQTDVLVLLIYIVIASVVKLGAGDQLDTFLGLQALILTAFGAYLIASIKKSISDIIAALKQPKSATQ